MDENAGVWNILQITQHNTIQKRNTQVRERPEEKKKKETTNNEIIAHTKKSIAKKHAKQN
jgi:hypothetical protein